jgi:carbon-monoxide dehydrogenase large subunit
VVAETTHQALDAAELIEVDYEPLPAIASTGEATAKGAPRVWDDCADNIGFVQLFGDKAATDAAFAKADHVVKHRFVINRVTAATMEPRGCIGDYNPTDGRYTAYTTLQRVHPYRADLAPILKVPESKIRVVAGDIGGSFRDEVGGLQRGGAGAVLASKLLGRPVKWTSTRSNPSSAMRRRATTSPTPNWRSTGRQLPRHAGDDPGQHRRYLQTGMQAFTGNIGTLAGVYRTPAIHTDVTAVFTTPIRCGPTAATAARRLPM